MSIITYVCEANMGNLFTRLPRGGVYLPIWGVLLWSLRFAATVTKARSKVSNSSVTSEESENEPTVDNLSVLPGASALRELVVLKGTILRLRAENVQARSPRTGRCAWRDPC